MKPRRALLTIVAVLVVVLAANLFTGRLLSASDLTREQSATLSESTRSVVARVDRRITITAFFPREAPGRVEAATLLSRYRKLNRRITFRIVDPRLVPGEAQRLGVTEVGSAAVTAVDTKDVEIAQYTIEIDITSAIARLLRPDAGTVCFTTGHGERSPDQAEPDGLSKAATVLRDNGYETRTFDLLARNDVPRDCDAVIVASPTSAFGDDATKALRSYLERSGKAIVLADPAAESDLSPIVRRWGIRFVRGVVIEADADSHLPGDLTAPIVRRYSGASSVTRGLGPTFYPGAEQVIAETTKDPGLSSGAVAVTTELAYLDRDDPSSFDPKVDRKGPIAIGVAADDSEVQAPGSERARILRTRVLAWGDVDWVTNRFFEDASNARLWIQSLDWLTQPEDVVTAVPSFPALRELALTEARSRYMLLLTAAFVPGLFLIAGGIVWAVRRGR